MYSQLRNESGFALVELLVVLALSSVVLLIVVTSALFVDKYVDRWSSRDRLDEEAVSIHNEFRGQAAEARSISDFGDSIVIVGRDDDRWVYSIAGGQVFRNGKPILRSGLLVASLSLSPFELQSQVDSVIIRQVKRGLYRLEASIVNSRNDTCSIDAVLRCPYEYYKYSP